MFPAGADNQEVTAGTKHLIAEFVAHVNKVLQGVVPSCYLASSLAFMFAKRRAVRVYPIRRIAAASNKFQPPP